MKNIRGYVIDKLYRLYSIWNLPRYRQCHHRITKRMPYPGHIANEGGKGVWRWLLPSLDADTRVFPDDDGDARRDKLDLSTAVKECRFVVYGVCTVLSCEGGVKFGLN